VTLNARVGAVALAISALMNIGFELVPANLVPMKLLVLGLATFGLWAFVDEMGVRKPLNRAGMVAFGFAVLAQTMALLAGDEAEQARFLLLYSFAVLTAIVLWSAAFLHRQRELKIVGAVGLFGAATPLAMLVLGHVFLGIGTLWGVSTLYQVGNPYTGPDPAVSMIINVVFAAWCLLASGFLWFGYIQADSRTMGLSFNKEVE
jgi:hypothetical protein